jgi:ABC-type multidrug transport system fused ATPase/permease subunit
MSQGTTALDGTAGAHVSRVTRIASFIRPYRGRIGLLIVIMVLSAAVANIYPFFVKYLVDEVFIQRNLNWLQYIVGGLALLALFQFGITFINGYLYTWLTARILLDMRLHLYDHIHRLSIRFFKETKVGDIISRLNSDMAQVQSIAMESLMTFLGSVMTIIVVSLIMVFFSWKLFLISCVAVPGIILLLRWFQPRLHRLARKIRDQNAEITSFVLEAFRGSKTVKVTGSRHSETRRFLRENKGLIRKVISFQIMSGFSSGLSGLLITAGSAAVLWFGGRMMIAGQLTAGDLMAFELFQIRLFGPVRSLVSLFLRLQKARASIDRVFEFLDIMPEDGDLPGAVRLSEVRGDVAFEGVSFSYEPGKPVLSEISFRVPSGSSLALVGPSGAGKTTIADLLFRLYRPDSGRVTVDGCDLQELKIRTLLRSMALVPQDSFLFNGTVSENIRYGAPVCGESEVREAAELANISEFIQRLPRGYDTVLGERGLRFSGGQAQRVALARAFLRRPRILVLDEATAALDWFSDQKVHLALKELMRGRTTILITHKMFMVQEMDNILVLDGSRVVQQGSHEELLGEDGLYRELYQQVRGDLDRVEVLSPVGHADGARR